ncbi:MAG: hypothetical protein PF689_09200, partial [Deltaproteobacteria bacterium]|nr:hypothetical protein [Deltaproteobacteria bacterium]
MTKTYKEKEALVNIAISNPLRSIKRLAIDFPPNKPWSHNTVREILKKEGLDKYRRRVQKYINMNFDELYDKIERGEIVHLFPGLQAVFFCKKVGTFRWKQDGKFKRYTLSLLFFMDSFTGKIFIWDNIGVDQNKNLDLEGVNKFRKDIKDYYKNNKWHLRNILVPQKYNSLSGLSLTLETGFKNKQNKLPPVFFLSHLKNFNFQVQSSRINLDKEFSFTKNLVDELKSF